MIKRILITGAGGNASVGFTRCLLKKGGYFLVGTDCNFQTILFSETHKKYFVPRADSPDYIDTLNKIIRKERVDFIHAQPDTEISVLSENREKLNTMFLLPEKETVRICQNKQKSYEILRDNKVPVPLSFLIKTKRDVLPVFRILKPPIWFRAIAGAGGKGSLLIKSPDIAATWIKHWEGFGNFMGAEYMPGRNLGWDSIWKDGKLLMSHLKVRLAYAVAGSVPSGISGTAGSVQSIRSRKIEDICKKAILAIDRKANGAFAVDLKEDLKGRACVTEINPGRFLSSSTHFFSEVNYLMPATFIDVGLGLKPSRVYKYPQGKFMLRSLDAKPIVYDSKYEAKIKKNLQKDNFFEV